MVAHRLLATQAQDPRGFRLAIRARTEATTGADVDAALTGSRSLLVTWLNRGTLHLVAREDYPLLQALVTPAQVTGNARRLAQHGIDAGLARRAVSLVDGWLAADGPLSRAALGDRLRSAGIPSDGQALVHLLFAASLAGVLVRGPVAGVPVREPVAGVPVGDAGTTRTPDRHGVDTYPERVHNDHSAHEQLHVRVADWLPEAPAAVAAVRADPARGFAELARRYLAGHGPADARDLARWLGTPLRDARRGLDANAHELRERPDGLVELRTAPPHVPPLPPPRLLGTFEPLLMGWRSRVGVLGDHAAAVVSGGVFRGVALVEGRAAAVWRFDGPRVAIEAVRPLSAPVRRALDCDAVAVARFLGR